MTHDHKESSSKDHATAPASTHRDGDALPDRNLAKAIALAIVRLNPHDYGDLIVHMQALQNSRANGRSVDTNVEEYLLTAIRECFERTDIDEIRNATTLDEFEKNLVNTTKGYDEARRRLDYQGTLFLRRYCELKAKAGLVTHEEVARAAGISTGTVQAIEGGRINRPHFKTLKALADAFKVGIATLIEE